MPVQSSDTSGIIFTADDQQWIVKAGVVVSTTATDASAVNIDQSGGQLLNHGDISGTGSGGSAIDVDVFGRDALIVNSADGTLTGSTAVIVRSSGIHLSNQGSIIGLSNYGVEYAFPAGASELHNSGYVYGKAAALFAGALETISIVNSGTIESPGDAISIALTQKAGQLVNTGTIIGGDYAVKSVMFRPMAVDNSGTIIGNLLLKGLDPQKVVNNGLIRGDVTFGNTADVYRGADGVLDGTVFASGGNDSLKGGGADDDFRGQEGQDQLFGRGGDDLLFGGTFGDKLKGGSGADTFLYEKVADSSGGASADTRLDTIVDFRSDQGDKLDFSRIELKNGDARQKLEFIGDAAFSGKKGEVRYEIKGDNAFVQLDSSGGKHANLEIKLKDVSTLHATDFDL